MHMTFANKVKNSQGYSKWRTSSSQVSKNEKLHTNNPTCTWQTCFKMQDYTSTIVHAHERQVSKWQISRQLFHAQPKASNMDNSIKNEL
jgi:hypothetical protein